MSEPVMPAPSDPEPHDVDPFSAFVNDELDLSPLGEDDPRRRPLNFFELPSLPSERSPSPPNNQDDFSDENDLARWEMPGDDQTVDDLLETHLPKRLTRGLKRKRPIPFPEPNDARWIDGVYRTVALFGFRVYTQPDVFSNRIAFSQLSWHWSRRVRYIPEIVPGWSAVQFNRSRLLPPLKGYVRTSDVKLVPRTGFLPNLISWLHEPKNIASVLEVAITIIVAIVLLNVLSGRDASAPQADEALQMTLSAQNERIANLEATLSFAFPGE
ncbi:MAG: hypothetical protein SNJ59_17195 [Aggregatilineales bacterium]